MRVEKWTLTDKRNTRDPKDIEIDIAEGEEFDADLYAKVCANLKRRGYEPQ